MSVTVEEVKAFCGTPMAPSIIQLYIDMIDSKIGACLLAYGAPLAKIIELNLVAHFTVGVLQGKKTSVGSPNGASISFATTATKEGMQSSAYGDAVVMLDVNQCWQNLVRTSYTMQTIGS